MKQPLAPICLFTYKRLDTLKQTVSALQKNHLASESNLFIFSDAAKTNDEKPLVAKVRAYIKTIEGFKDVQLFESPTNKGLANSIISGVTQIIERYGKVIVLEDDLISSPNFLDFMNQALYFYRTEKDIQSINGYSLKVNSRNNHIDIYFHQRTFPWGWATWKGRWNQTIFTKGKISKRIDANRLLLHQFKYACGGDISSMLMASLTGRNDSWYVRWAFDHFIHDKYAVYPKLSKINNVGFNDEGTHCTGINVFVSELDKGVSREFNFSKFIITEKNVDTQFLNYFKRTYKLWFRIKLFTDPKGRHRIIKEMKHRFLKKFLNGRNN